MGEGKRSALRVDFDGQIRLEFHGANVTSDAGLLAYRELDEALGLTTEVDELGIHDPRTGQSEIMVPAAHLIPPDESAPLVIDNYTWSDDRSLVLIYTNSKRVWRRKTRGDYWVLDRSSHELIKLGGDAQSATLMFAKISL